MDKNLIFFGTLRECFKDDARNLPLVELEGSVIGPADQVVGEHCLDDTQWTSHVYRCAKSLPKCSDTEVHFDDPIENGIGDCPHQQSRWVATLQTWLLSMTAQAVES